MTARTKQNDVADVRCAFDNGRGKHDLGTEPEDMWCHGCKFYICDGCSKNISPMGRHDVSEHLEGEDGE